MGHEYAFIADPPCLSVVQLDLTVSSEVRAPQLHPSLQVAAVQSQLLDAEQRAIAGEQQCGNAEADLEDARRQLSDLQRSLEQALSEAAATADARSETAAVAEAAAGELQGRLRAAEQRAATAEAVAAEAQLLAAEAEEAADAARADVAETLDELRQVRFPHLVPKGFCVADSPVQDANGPGLPIMRPSDALEGCYMVHSVIQHLNTQQLPQPVSHAACRQQKSLSCRRWRHRKPWKRHAPTRPRPPANCSRFDVFPL